jgi:hypothetical protein
MLIANPIDLLFAACLKYINFFSIDNSEARKQYDEEQEKNVHLSEIVSRETTHRFRTSNNAKSNPEINGRNSIF